MRIMKQSTCRFGKTGLQDLVHSGDGRFPAVISEAALPQAVPLYACWPRACIDAFLSPSTSTFISQERRAARAKLLVRSRDAIVAVRDRPDPEAGHSKNDDLSAK